MSAPHIVVISDLHMSAAALDDFDQELEGHFVRFLEVELASFSAPVELVINGDFLDFVQAPPWRGRELESQTTTGLPLCFTEAQSEEKLRAIHAGHVPSFHALHNFLSANPGNTLVILPGNHDPDFFWPSVSQLFKNLISDGDFATGQMHARKFGLNTASNMNRSTHSPSQTIHIGVLRTLLS